MNEISFSNWQTFAIIIFNETKFQKKKKKRKTRSYFILTIRTKGIYEKGGDKKVETFFHRETREPATKARDIKNDFEYTSIKMATARNKIATIALSDSKPIYNPRKGEVRAWLGH